MVRLWFWLLPYSTALIWLYLGSGARAQSCVTDADCAQGEYCVRAPSSPASCAGDPGCPTPAPAAGSCEKDTRCRTDADCPMGVKCAKEMSAPDCPPDAGDCSAQQIETGQCKPQPIACKSAADCPEPLSCETRRASNAKQTCEYVPVTCASNKDCGANYACTVVATSSNCSGSGTTCAPGSMNCSQPSEPVCTHEEHKACFPKRMDCTSDATCPRRWRCAALPKDAQKNPPAGWTDATKACFPEGIALALMGLVEVGGASSASAASNHKQAVTSEQASPGGCSVSANDQGSGVTAAWPWIAAALFAARRRSAAQHRSG